MSFGCFKFLVFCTFLVFVTTGKTGSKPEGYMGSYINVLHRVVPCDHPIKPYMKNPKEFIDLRAKGQILIVNLTFTEKTNNVVATLQDFYYIGGKWQRTFFAKNMSCHSKAIAVILEFMGLIYDKKMCSAPKGSYWFEVDYNKLDHLLWVSQQRTYGRMIRRIEARCMGGTIFCRDIESEVKPAS